jgi:hypothetical protein
MSTETLPRQGLNEQLAELAPEAQESQAQFLGRAAVVAGEFESHILTEEELRYVGQMLPGWLFSKSRFHAKRLGRADRQAPVSQEQYAMIGDYRTDRRVIAPDAESGNIALLATAALTGSDIAAILEIESASDLLAKSPASAPPKLRSHNGVNGSSPESAKLNEASGLLLSETELTTINLLPLPLGEIAKRLEIDKSAVSKRITFALERNEMDRPEFLTRAVRGQLIDMGLLPKPKEYALTDIEKRAIRDYTFAKLADAAQGLGLQSISQASLLRRKINQKLGIVGATQTRTYLIAIRDGVI